MSKKIDTRGIGLDVGLAFNRWLTGAENLHYGLWTGLEVTAANLRAAQEAYSRKLLALLPKGPLRILDIGGGAGETAKSLIALGHSVEIVVPSAFLAGRCRVNAPQAVVHECTFQDYAGKGPFDLCLFSESFQYIPPALSLTKCLTLLAPKGEIVIGDCFRTEAFQRHALRTTVGGGHSEATVRKIAADLKFRIVSEEDVTEAVAPSVDLEQALFNVVGHALTRTDEGLTQTRPKSRWLIHRALNAVLSRRRRARLAQRLFEQSRTSAEFIENNRYLLLRLKPEA